MMGPGQSKAGMASWDSACKSAERWDDAQRAANDEWCASNPVDCQDQKQAILYELVLGIDIAATILGGGSDIAITGPVGVGASGKLAQLLARAKWALSAFDRFAERFGKPSGIWSRTMVTLGDHGRGSWFEDLFFAINGRTRKLPFNFKDIDDWEPETGTVTSMKSYEPNAYTPAGLSSNIQRDIMNLAGYQGGASPSRSIQIRPDDILGRRLQVAVNPASMNWDYERQLYQAYVAAAQAGVDLQIYAVP